MNYSKIYHWVGNEDIDSKEHASGPHGWYNMFTNQPVDMGPLGLLGPSS